MGGVGVCRKGIGRSLGQKLFGGTYGAHLEVLYLPKSGSKEGPATI